MTSRSRLSKKTAMLLMMVIGCGSWTNHVSFYSRTPPQEDKPTLLDRDQAGRPTKENLPNGGYKEVYRNKQGQRIHEKEYNGLLEVKERDILTVHPNGKPASVKEYSYGIAHGKAGARVKYEEIEYDKTGTIVKRMTLTDVDEEGGYQTKIVTENGQTKIYKRNENGQFEELKQGSARTSPPPNAIPTSTAPGYNVATSSDNGLNTIAFTTPRGAINVNLTDDLAANDTITGTVNEQPAGKTETERLQNQAELNGYVVEIEEKQTPASDKTFTCDIPGTLNDAARTMTLWFKGKKVATTEIPIGETPQPKPPTEIQSGGQQGRTIRYRGDCNGRPDPNDYVKLGGKTLELLAESPRQKIVRNSTDMAGRSEIECNENGVHTECPFRNIRVRLSAPKTHLLRGEQTTLTMTVDGLEQLNENLPWDLIDATPNVLIIKEGNKQEGTIHPAEVNAEGVYNRQFTLEGIQPGAFNINATVRWNNVCRGGKEPGIATGGPRRDPDGHYEVCGSGCRPPSEKGEYVFCLQQGACKDRGANCECNLFEAPKSDKSEPWKWVAGPFPAKWQRVDGKEYSCQCTKKK